MTQREQEILEIIEKDPLISQNNLAKKVGITRSSVGVHISNLMKKGLIAGKGYVLNREPYVVVIGAVNIDISGIPNMALTEKDSNPGKVRMSVGGVGRNIAHNLSLLGARVKLLTTFGDDLYGEQIVRSCRELQIDITDSLTIAKGATSTYMFIADEHGDMRLAIADMDIYEHLTPQYLSSKLDIINNAMLCIFDTNIPQKTIEYLAENCTCPLFADTVSTHKAVKLKSIMHKLHTIKPNLIEAELLAGMTVKTDSDLKKLADKLLQIGLSKVFISLGADGVYVADKATGVKLPCYPANIVNTTGAGDSFMAALAIGHIKGEEITKAAKLGLSAASLCIEAEDTINSELNYNKVIERINENEKFN